MRYAILAALACTFLVGAGPPDQQCPEMYLDGRPPTVVHAAAPEAGSIFCHSLYSVSYSTQRKDPLWSAEHLTKAMAVGGDQIGRKNRKFAPQAGLSASDQGAHDDYTGTGYDRGHMTPANDAGDFSSQKDTFVVTNIVPQTPQLNERLWAYLEAAVHRLAEDDDEVYVVTGPVFAEQPSLLNGRIEVPIATFKAIYAPKAGTGEAFIASNSSAPTCIVVSLAELTARTGIDAFPGLEGQVKSAAPALALKPGWQFKHGHAPSNVPLPNCSPN